MTIPLFVKRLPGPQFPDNPTWSSCTNNHVTKSLLFIAFWTGKSFGWNVHNPWRPGENHIIIIIIIIIVVIAVVIFIIIIIIIIIVVVVVIFIIIIIIIIIDWFSLIDWLIDWLSYVYLFI